jgi:ankyrin repeat protein
MDRSTSLADAVRASDTVTVGRELDAGANPDTVDPSSFQGKPVLTVAAERGDAEVVALLLKAGATSSPSYSWDWTPLRAAINGSHLAVVSILLEHGVDPNSPSGRGSMLTEAADAARHHPGPDALPVLETLLRAGATVGPGEESALVRAVEHSGPPAVLRLLVDYGSDPGQHRSDGTPILVLAVRRRDHAGVDCLVRAGADVNACDGRGRTALMHAAELGLDPIAMTVLNSGGDRDLTDEDGLTALMLAKSWHRLNMQSMLGERSVHREPVDARRTTMELVPRTYELRGSRDLFDLWARLIDHTIEDLGESEYQTIVGYTGEESRVLATRLRKEPALGVSPAEWHLLGATSTEVGIVRGCLLNLAYGPPMEMPEGLSRVDVCDLFEELAAQLRS